MWLKRIVLIAVFTGILFAFRTFIDGVRIHIPDSARPPKTLTLEQNWSPQQRAAFHHTAQGTRLLPWSWFQALEQPCLALTGCDLLSDPAYLARFGFIPSESNPDHLPIGFARQDNFHDPLQKKTYSVVGFTCAACHTGELFYKDYAIRIEGGSAVADLGTFQRALGLALIFNKYIPGRNDRFEKRILGDEPNPQAQSELRAAIAAFMETAMKERAYVEDHKIYKNQAGFSRTDALTRIGNQVFAVDLGIFENFQQSNAPVRFPQIWDAPWLDWIQFNASIAGPLERNIGEALGVRAMLNPNDLDHSIDIAALHELETLVAGPEPYQGLRSPKWPAVFPPLDAAKVQEGETLYRKHCIGCHLPPPAELVADRAAPKPKHWYKSSGGAAFLKVTEINIQRIGTDPRSALDFHVRTANTGPLKKGLLTAAEGLDFVTRAIANRYFDANDFPPERRAAWSGYRSENGESVRDRLVYKARPLNGIWAAAPFLHNGSVPSLYLLLSPHSERPKIFYSGSKQFDPVHIGYQTAKFEGAFEFDVTAPGNANTGHEFNDGPRGNGIIGPKLTPDERWALIEFLKSL